MATKPTKDAPKGDINAASILALQTRIENLERNQALIREGFTFAANECRPLFSFGPIALIFDAIAEKLQK